MMVRRTAKKRTAEEPKAAKSSLGAAEVILAELDALSRPEQEDVLGQIAEWAEEEGLW